MASELRDNGGPTLTLAVTSGDAGHNAGSREYLQTTLTDQRGFPRIAGGRVDIGAHEFAAGAVYVVGPYPNSADCPVTDIIFSMQ